MNFTEDEIIKIYKESLDAAEERLSSLAVAEGRKPSLRGLNGWAFEQTIRYCLLKEMEAVGLHPEMEDQVPLFGRAKIDLRVGKVAIELKARGSFGTGDSKYGEYRSVVEKCGRVYFYLTQQESHDPYKQITKSIFGPARAFFLDDKGDWARFVDAVVASHL